LETFYYFKGKRMPLPPKKRCGTIPNGKKNTQKYPKLRQQPLLVVSTSPIV